jgi:hypothetical protein
VREPFRVLFGTYSENWLGLEDRAGLVAGASHELFEQLTVAVAELERLDVDPIVMRASVWPSSATARRVSTRQTPRIEAKVRRSVCGVRCAMGGCPSASRILLARLAPSPTRQRAGGLRAVQAEAGQLHQVVQALTPTCRALRLQHVSTVPLVIVEHTVEHRAGFTQIESYFARRSRRTQAPSAASPSPEAVGPLHGASTPSMSTVDAGEHHRPGRPALDARRVDVCAFTAGAIADALARTRARGSKHAGSPRHPPLSGGRLRSRRGLD